MSNTALDPLHSLVTLFNQWPLNSPITHSRFLIRPILGLILFHYVDLVHCNVFLEPLDVSSMPTDTNADRDYHFLNRKMNPPSGFEPPPGILFGEFRETHLLRTALTAELQWE